MCTPNALLRAGGVLIFYYLPLANNTFFLENINNLRYENYEENKTVLMARSYRTRYPNVLYYYNAKMKCVVFIFAECNENM